MNPRDVHDLAYGDAPDSFDSPDGRTYSGPVTAPTPGQADDVLYAAYEAYAMAAPDDLNFAEWDEVPAWQKQAIDAALQAGREAIAAQGARPAPDVTVDTKLRQVLKEHFLMTVVCDPEKKRDNPVCQCSRVHLGWHPSIGAAVDAWIDHVAEVLAATRAAPGPDVCECGHYWAHHAFSDDACAVPDCPCDGYRRTPRPAPEVAAAMAESRRYLEALQIARSFLLDPAPSGRRRAIAAISKALEGK